MAIQIITDHITPDAVKQIAADTFIDMAKAVIDIQRGVMAIGGELHADAEAVLLQQGSQSTDLWGINLYPEQPNDTWIEFDSMINIRPQQGNRSCDIEDAIVRERIRAVVEKLTT